MGPKDADRMANSVDADQTAPLWAVLVLSESTLFAQTCQFENLWKLIVQNLNLIASGTGTRQPTYFF